MAFSGGAKRRPLQSLVGQLSPSAIVYTQASIIRRTDEPHSAEPEPVGRTVRPNVRRYEFRYQKNSEVTHIDSEEHGPFLFRGVTAGFFADRLVYPGGGSLDVDFDPCTAGRNVPPERRSRARGNDLDHNPLVAVSDNAIFTRTVRRARIDDGDSARRTEDVEDSREDILLPTFSGIDRRLNEGPNARVDED